VELTGVGGSVRKSTISGIVNRSACKSWRRLAVLGLADWKSKLINRISGYQMNQKKVSGLAINGIKNN
jgi:hypothetical protein